MGDRTFYFLSQELFFGGFAFALAMRVRQRHEILHGVLVDVVGKQTSHDVFCVDEWGVDVWVQDRCVVCSQSLRDPGNRNRTMSVKTGRKK